MSEQINQQLVIGENDPDIRGLMEFFAQDTGADIIKPRSTKEVIQMIDEGADHITYVLDGDPYRRQGIDGLGILGHIIDNGLLDQDRDVKVILTTRDPDQFSDFKQLIASGEISGDNFEIVEKPFEIKSFQDTLTSFVGNTLAEGRYTELLSVA